MIEYNSIRWERIKELEVEFSYIKAIVIKIFDYQIRESNLDDFIKNIDKYRDINECKLLDELEGETYKKMVILSIRRYKKNKHMPIIEDITNSVYSMIFKTSNGVKMANGEHYDGQLDECFKVTYLKKDDKFATIKLSRVITNKLEENLEDGTTNLVDKTIYDCCKFIIDINNKLVAMFFNDIKNSNKNITKEITLKKCAFRSLFAEVTNKNIIKYYLNTYLEKYFKSYMEDKRNGNERKLISIIEASCIDGICEERSLIRSINNNYIHSDQRLMAIEDDVNKKGLTISELECCINDSIVDLKMDGEITCVNSFFYEEVITNVCKEFFGGYKLS
ncbi:hypothetical protein [Clostridium tunisiense]|uniref:hypothetical protein n=1 Tax=Clostridium tunisiense TaxID=219748 RepID=UPI0002EFDA5A|nr:hypothetical protein [Clostridium tunisiense]